MLLPAQRAARHGTWTAAHVSRTCGPQKGRGGDELTCPCPRGPTTRAVLRRADALLGDCTNQHSTHHAMQPWTASEPDPHPTWATHAPQRKHLAKQHATQTTHRRAGPTPTPPNLSAADTCKSFVSAQRWPVHTDRRGPAERSYPGGQCGHFARRGKISKLLKLHRSGPSVPDGGLEPARAGRRMLGPHLCPPLRLFNRHCARHAPPWPPHPSLPRPLPLSPPAPSLVNRLLSR
jgi:hypothetical protein